MNIQGTSDTVEGREIAHDRPRDESPLDPFNEWPFLRAAQHHGPGHGRARRLEIRTRSQEVSHWGVIERSKFGFRAAVAYARPSTRPDSSRSEVWDHALRELASSGNDLVRMNNHATVRLTADDHACVRDIARRNAWRLSTERFGTYVIDLALDAGTRLKRMHKSHRQSIAAAARAGLELVTLKTHEISEYLRVSDATYERQGRVGISHEYLRGLAAIEHGFRFYACRDARGETQVVSVVALVGDKAIGLHGGSGNRPTRGAGQWCEHAIADALAEDGFAVYDLGGVDPFAQTPKAIGIREFKARFGGTLEYHDAIEIAFRPRRAKLIEWGLAGARALARSRARGRGVA